MTDEAWIEQSLARLETLETQKSELEAAGQPVPADLHEEMATLYEVLESAADEGPEPAPAPVPTAAPAPAGPFAAAPMMAPQVAPAIAAPQPMTPMTPMDDDGLDDYKSGGKGGLIAVVGIVLLAAGAGGYWYTTQNKAPQKAPEPVGEAKVISASSVPEDTQEPRAAKGGSAERTPGTEIPEGESAPKRAANNGAGGAKKPRPTNNKKKKDGRKVESSDSRDPLAGI